jgi:hypothetical protein
MTALRLCLEIYNDPPVGPAGRADRQHSVTYSYSRTLPAVVAGLQKSDSSLLTYPDPILKWFLNSFPGWYRNTWHQLTFNRAATVAETPKSVTVFTEISLGGQTDDKTIMRAHPNYRGSGPWFDFAIVNYGIDGLFPVRIAAFFQVVEGGEIMALVQEVMHQNDHKQQKSEQSLLFEHYHMSSELVPGANATYQAVFKVFGVSTLASPAYCIDTNADRGPMFLHNRPKQGKSPFPIVRVSDNRNQWPLAILKQGENLCSTQSRRS